MLSHHLFHFALVHEEFNKTGDITRGLLPLFSPIFSDKEGETYDPSEVSEAMNQLYGIEMHPLVAEELAPKLLEKGVLAVKEIHRHQKPMLFRMLQPYKQPL